MKHGSLFTGIGGFDLAAQWLGFENIFQVEINPFCQRVLRKNFPQTDLFSDIKTFKGDRYERTIDIISGGFPCQPFSISGKRKGKEDDRFLWDEMLRILSEVKPPWVVAENVPGIVTMELDEILSSLESEGYTTETYLIPALAVNAPHKRERVWIIAYSSSNGLGKYGYSEVGSKETKTKGEENQREWIWTKHNGANEKRFIANSKTIGLESSVTGQRQKQSWRSNPRFREFSHEWQTVEPTIFRTDDGFSDWMDSIKALGNAIVPQIAFNLFSLIEDFQGKIL
jgi:DNA (cytosine-5)-methyltransferase 1